MISRTRIRQIRAESESEHRTHEWADRVIDELLTEAETRNAVDAAVRGRTDSRGRNLAQRIAAVRRGGTPPTAAELDEAYDLLVLVLAAGARYGLTLDDWDWVDDLPGTCRDLIRRKHR
ncbi:hypothetical protein KV205_05220 [Streptomyces sp. SKN60]|uniref:hypothetical protein n=1 Tax=Streptomyces sp. SKN60 TaxID=2855506 RepID=UPI0022470548|nr:hypothetical protein [Streptomyces sp. SKN60]MCX2179932.1 hypothetical protein [Streptomyces sp. SKN60]